MVKLIQRLLSQGDEVRVLVDQGATGEIWRDLGAHVAFGPADDEDLVWRASTGVRTLVFGDLPGGESTLAPLLAGAERAGVSRAVVCAPQPGSGVTQALAATGLEYVVLTTARRPLMGRPKPKIPLSKLAEAIDAADDLQGRLRLELDLTVEQSWQVLRVVQPES